MGKPKRSEEAPILAGFACADITPAGSLPMGGYIERAKPATGMHDPLFAKAVALRSAGASLILISLDILLVQDKWVRRVKDEISKELAVPRGNILIAATHTHSGPGVFFPADGRPDSVISYEEKLSGICLRIAREAFASAEPSVLSACSSFPEGIGRNRRNPLDTADILMSVVRVESPARKVRGHLVSFACHPTVMPPSNLEYSADLFGVAARRVEEKYADSVCMMFNGAAGDISTRFTRRAQTWEELDRLGKKLAAQIIRAGKSLQTAKAGPIITKTVSMKFPFRRILPVAKAQKRYDEALRSYQAPAYEPDNSDDMLLARSLVEGAAAQLVLSRIGGWEPLFGTKAAEVEIQLMRAGGIIFCSLPGEFFGRRGLELSRASLPKLGFVIGYANGYWGYFVPPREAARGGYEVMMSPLAPADEKRVAGEAKRLIKEIKRKPARKKQDV